MSSWFFWIEDIAISFVKLAIFKMRFLGARKLRTSCLYDRIVTDSQLDTTQAGESKFDYDFLSSNYNANQLLEISNFWLFTKATIFVGSWWHWVLLYGHPYNKCAPNQFFVIVWRVLRIFLIQFDKRFWFFNARNTTNLQFFPPIKSQKW